MKKQKLLKKRYVHKYKNSHQKKSYKHTEEYLKKHQKQKRHYKKRDNKIEVVTIAIEKPVEVVVKERRGRKPRGSSVDRMYFTQNTEDAIVEYNASTDIQIRENIYNTKIKYPFEKLVENIFNTFKFSYFETGPLDVQKETVSHLVSNIHKYEQSKGKAFAYFSIVAKHYLIALNNSTYKRRNQHVEISEEYDEHTVQLQTEDKHHKDAEMKEFMNLMIVFWENNVGKIFTKQRDLDIANAVIELFRNSDRIDAFNKKALYLYIREISSCKTQQITKVINRMKQYQTTISKSYLNVGIVNTENYLKV